MDQAQIHKVGTARPSAGVTVAAGTTGRAVRPPWTEWLTTTDHKKIGTMYLVTAFAFFIVGGVIALLMRAELARPRPADHVAGTVQPGVHHARLDHAADVRDAAVHRLRQLDHAPQIGAPDVAFPRLNMLAYWLFLFGSSIAAFGFLTPGGAADFGWFLYAPLSDAVHSPGLGADLWIMGVALSGFGSILGAVNFITTIVCMRAPGMTMFRMPIFTWNVLLTAVLVLIVFPVLAAALFALKTDRKFGAHVFEAANGGALLWQHLFWFSGQPEVYILALPFFGIVSEVIPVFARKPMFGYMGLIGATIAIAGLSVTVWAHHMCQRFSGSPGTRRDNKPDLTKREAPGPASPVITATRTTATPRGIRSDRWRSRADGWV